MDRKAYREPSQPVDPDGPSQPPAGAEPTEQPFSAGGSGLDAVPAVSPVLPAAGGANGEGVGEQADSDPDAVGSRASSGTTGAPTAVCRCGATERSETDPARCARGHVLVGTRGPALKTGIYARRQPADLAPAPPDWRDRIAAMFWDEAARIEGALGTLPVERLRSFRLRSRLIDDARQLRVIAEELRAARPGESDDGYDSLSDEALDALIDERQTFFAAALGWIRNDAEAIAAALLADPSVRGEVAARLVEAGVELAAADVAPSADADAADVDAAPAAVDDAPVAPPDDRPVVGQQSNPRFPELARLVREGELGPWGPRRR